MTFKLKLRAKLFNLTAFLLIGFSLSLCIYLKTVFAKIMTDELLKRGSSITRHLAEISTGAFIEHDFLQLESLAKGYMNTEADIVYILMLNQNNEVIAHSFQNSYPLDLKEIKPALVAGETSILSIDFGGIPVYDIATPAMDARIGSVRIGISAQPVHQAVETMIQQILYAILFLGLITLFITLPALQTILRPISALTHAVKELTQGNRKQKLPISSNDELGLLTNAFNHMVANISYVEQRLAAQVEFLQVLIDDIPLPVFYQNKQGEMLGCNHVYADFLGKPKQELVGQHTNDIYVRNDAELHLRKDKQLFEQQTPVSYEHTVADAKGLTKHVIFNKALFNDEKGVTAGVIGVMLDVTEQRRINQMKSEFVSTVAHEFQTPLATIMGFTELIQSNTLNQTERHEALDLIIRKVQSLSEMVDELLDQARLEAGKGMKIVMEPCNVGEFLSKLINNFKKRTASHRFVLKLPEEDVIVSADKTRLGQVMENLLSNAVKYSDQLSTVNIVTTTGDTYCQVQVSDQGIGMTEKQTEHIYEKYYRADTSDTAPTGTGLGMFITKSIINAHNGEIKVDSILGQGTTVTFRIPTKTAQVKSSP